MTVERFHPDHLREIDLQPAQQAAAAAFEDAEYLVAIARGTGGTLRNADGKAIACGGVVEVDGGSIAWAFLSRDAGRNMVALVRAARRLMDTAPLPVLTTAACDFPQGCRLLELLGFERQPEPVDDVSLQAGPHYVYVRSA